MGSYDGKETIDKGFDGSRFQILDIQEEIATLRCTYLYCMAAYYTKESNWKGKFSKEASTKGFGFLHYTQDYHIQFGIPLEMVSCI